MTRTENQTAKSFLDLPGEIRNRIYKHCQVPQILKRIWELYDGSRDYIFYQKIITLYPGTCQELHWQNQQRHHLGLTQTCRQIRAEYLPIYMRLHKFKVDYHHIDRYASTFLLRPGVEETEAAGYLRLRLSISRETIDLLPFLRLCAKAPALQIRFSANETALALKLDQLLPHHHFYMGPEKNLWADFMQTALSKIHFQYSMINTSLDFWLKKEFKSNTKADLENMAWIIKETPWVEYGDWVGEEFVWYEGKGKRGKDEVLSGLLLQRFTGIVSVRILVEGGEYGD